MMGSPGDLTGPINLGRPEEVTMVELAERVILLTRSRSKVVYRPIPGDDPRQRLPDISKAQRLLDWSPTVRLDYGLMETIQYFDRLLACHGAKPDQIAAA